MVNDKTCVHFLECGLDFCLNTMDMECKYYEHREIIQSIRPKWVNLIFKGLKDKELRKSKPTGDRYPFKVYVYETKPGAGAIVGEYTCTKIVDDAYPGYAFIGSCVSMDEIVKYKGNGKICCWSIIDVIKYEKPKPLLEFGLKRPPQSWCYVERMV